MIFIFFTKIAIIRLFSFRNIVKITKFTRVIIFWFALKNDNLGLQIKILKFLGIQPTFINYSDSRNYRIFRNANPCWANSRTPWRIRWKFIEFNVALVASTRRYGKFLTTGFTITTRSSISRIPKGKTVDPKQYGRLSLYRSRTDCFFKVCNSFSAKSAKKTQCHPSLSTGVFQVGTRKTSGNQICCRYTIQ